MKEDKKKEIFKPNKVNHKKKELKNPMYIKEEKSERQKVGSLCCWCWSHWRTTEIRTEGVKGDFFVVVFRGRRCFVLWRLFDTPQLIPLICPKRVRHSCWNVQDFLIALSLLFFLLLFLGLFCVVFGKCIWLNVKFDIEGDCGAMGLL